MKTTLLKVKIEYLFLLVRFMYILRKSFFNSLVAKEEGILKMVDGSAYEVINTRTVKVTRRDVTVRLWRQSGMFRRYGTI